MDVELHQAFQLQRKKKKQEEHPISGVTTGEGGGVLLGINDDLKYQQNKIEMKSRAYQTLDNEV